MRNLMTLNAYRDSATAQRIYGWAGDGTCGCFRIPSPIDKAIMIVIASSEDGWEHISVSRANRCPNWPEMDFIKRMFFRDDEVVMQLHVPVKDHINMHPHCLHLWKPTTERIPCPPGWMVG